MKRQLSFPQFLKSTVGYSVADIEDFIKDAAKHFQLFPEVFANRFAGHYIFYYPQSRYIYMNDRMAQLAGRSIPYLQEIAFGLKQQIRYKPDEQVYNEIIFRENLSYFKSLPIEQHAQHMVSSNYRIKRKGELRNIMQESFFIRSAEDGTPLLVLGFVTDVSHLWNDGKVIHTIYNPNGDLQTHSYSAELHNSELSLRELEVLVLSQDGHTMHEIAARLNIHYKTVDNIKQHINKKLGVHSTLQAVKKASQIGII